MNSRVRFLALFCVILALTVQISAKDNWIAVKSKNFDLIGNATEKEIRQVATKLEQFRETFRQIFPRLKLSVPVPTTVIVFKNDAAYRPFKPKDAKGRPIDAIAGYFLPGADVNYITIGIDKDMNDTYGTIFHEYVHFILEANYGKTVIPPWFNEGLAEYYQTFKIENDQKVSLGVFQEGHLYLLQQYSLIPLREFFAMDYYAVHQGGNHSRSIFYAQAWALIHYLIQGRGGDGAALGNFVGQVLNGGDPEKAFRDSFKMDYATAEKALREYVSQKRYQLTVLQFKEKLVFDTQMTMKPISEAESNSYLGDLLAHSRDYEAAETYLSKALELDPKSSFANTSLGLVKMRQRKFAEAKKYLENAIGADARNHLAHYNYAYVLSREGMDEFNMVQSYPRDAVEKMSKALTRAIELNPSFTPSYELLSFVYLVNDEKLDEAVTMLRKASEINPADQGINMILAQIYLRQEKLAEAKAITEKLLRSAADEDHRRQAERILDSINQWEARKAEYDRQEKDLEARGIKRPEFIRRDGEKPLSDEEVEKIKKHNENLNLNRIVKRPKDGEAEIIGYVEKVFCGRGEIAFTIRTETETVLLTSKDFANLELVAQVEGLEGVSFGCDADIKAFKTVAIYSSSKPSNPKSKGTLLSLTFVPTDFVRMSVEEMANTRQKVIIDESAGSAIGDGTKESPEQIEKRRREAMIESIRGRLLDAADGETRIFGYIEKVECSSNSFVLVVRTDESVVKLRARQPKIRSFTADASAVNFTCGATPPKVNAFFIFKGGLLNPGELQTIEFVPKEIGPQ